MEAVVRPGAVVVFHTPDIPHQLGGRYRVIARSSRGYWWGRRIEKERTRQRSKRFDGGPEFDRLGNAFPAAEHLIRVFRHTDARRPS